MLDTGSSPENCAGRTQGARGGLGAKDGPGPRDGPGAKGSPETKDGPVTNDGPGAGDTAREGSGTRSVGQKPFNAGKAIGSGAVEDNPLAFTSEPLPVAPLSLSSSICTSGTVGADDTKKEKRKRLS